MSERESQVLLVEDNPGDVELTKIAFKRAKIRLKLHVASDGVEAMAFLRAEAPFLEAPRPALILLDLNMPRMNGREVLARVKADPALRTIPVIVLTTSPDAADVRKAYDLMANCYITKPVDFIEFARIVKSIDEFWFSTVNLPAH